MFRTSMSVVGVAWLLVGFAGCGSSNRHFSSAAGGNAGASQGGVGGASGGSPGGRGGSIGSEAGEGGSIEAAGAGEGGVGGEAGESEAGAGGMAGEASVSTLAIVAPNLGVAKTYAPFSGAISATGAVRYTWSVSSGALPSGVTLQGTQTATVTIAGTPTEAGQFPLSFSVTDGVATKTVNVTLFVSHSAVFLSDRNVAGVNELFITELGADSAAAPVRLSASFPTGGGVSSYSWAPDGSRVMYLAAQSATAAAELWVVSLSSPGNAQRVSAPGVAIGQAVWLGAGNIAAYSTSTGDTYLTDLSVPVPSTGKLVATGKGSVATLRPSPNGKSVGIAVPGTNANEMSYATWSPTAAPTVVSFGLAQGSGPFFSYDGRYGVIFSGPSGSWYDLTLAAPTATAIPSNNGIGLSWSPNAETLFTVTGTASAFDFSRGDFTSSGWTKTILVSSTNCNGTQVRWSPDGKNGLFVCAADVRGINNLPAALAGSDFTLLPSGFLSKTYTDTPATGWSPDSKWVALRADRDADAQYDLQLIRWAAPGTAYKPHASSIGAGVTTWAFAPDSRAVAFVGTLSPYANANLYLTKLPASGAPPNATIASAPASAVVQSDVNWLPGARVIAYRALVGNAAQLFAVPVGADGSPGSVVSISGAMGAVSSYQLAPTR